MKVEGGKETWDLDGPFQDPVVAISKRGRSALGTLESKRYPKPPGAQNSLQLYWRFFCAGLSRHTQTGALLPSQRFLIERMIEPVRPDYKGEIVELGAGTGALTFRLLDRCPQARVLACEINPELALELKARTVAAGLTQRVRISSEPAERLLLRLPSMRATPPEFVFSGIPLGNLVKERATALISVIHQALAASGLYVQFQHSLLDRRKIKVRFAHLCTKFVLMNMPPAFVYFARK